MGGGIKKCFGSFIVGFGYFSFVIFFVKIWFCFVNWGFRGGVVGYGLFLWLDLGGFGGVV